MKILNIVIFQRVIQFVSRWQRKISLKWKHIRRKCEIREKEMPLRVEDTLIHHC